MSEFTVHLAVRNPDRIHATMAPLSKYLLDLVREANASGAIAIDDPKRSAALVQQTVMYSWLGNRLIQNPRARLSAEETWDFCLHGLRG